VNTAKGMDKIPMSYYFTSGLAGACLAGDFMR